MASDFGNGACDDWLKKLFKNLKKYILKFEKLKKNDLKIRKKNKFNEKKIQINKY